MPTLLLAFIGFNTDRVVQFVLNLLAVGGGFLVGWMLTGLVAWLLDRWITGGKSPIGVHRVARTLGGVAVAILIALMLFNRGGGPGEGPGTGGPAEKGEGPGGLPQTEPTVRELPPPPVPQKNDTTPREVVQVTILAGEDVKEEKYYLIEDDRTPHTLTELAEFLRKRKETSKRPIRLQVQYAPGAGYDTIGAAQLRRWGDQNGVDVGRAGR